MDYLKYLNYDNNSLPKFFMDLVLIFGPNIAFISQILKFRSSKSSEGFSKKIIFIILLANILRVFFWVGKKFDKALLLQAIVSIIMQIFLLNESLKASNYENRRNYAPNVFENFTLSEDEDNENEDYELNKTVEIEKNILKNPKKNEDEVIKYTKIQGLIEENSTDDILKIEKFWKWPFLIDYIFFCIFITIIIGMIYAVFGIHNNFFVELLGYCSLMIESMIGIPQIKENYKNKSTKNLSFFMIFIWLSGDTMKTLYFSKFKAPIQFIVCGIFQMIVDTVIIFQINYYR